jgi:hypothetical protein
LPGSRPDEPSSRNRPGIWSTASSSALVFQQRGPGQIRVRCRRGRVARERRIGRDQWWYGCVRSPYWCGSAPRRKRCAPDFDRVVAVVARRKAQVVANERLLPADERRVRAETLIDRDVAELRDQATRGRGSTGRLRGGCEDQPHQPEKGADRPPRTSGFGHCQVSEEHPPSAPACQWRVASASRIGGVERIHVDAPTIETSAHGLPPPSFLAPKTPQDSRAYRGEPRTLRWSCPHPGSLLV